MMTLQSQKINAVESMKVTSQEHALRCLHLPAPTAAPQRALQHPRDADRYLRQPWKAVGVNLQGGERAGT